MCITYTTLNNGTVLKLERVSRRELDAVFARLPQPTPPINTRTVWGGMEEEYLDYDNAEYKDLYTVWLMTLSDVQFEVMAQGITLSMDPSADPTYNELKLALGWHGDEKLNYLRYVALNTTDFLYITENILYLSTVTQKGIDAATALYAVEWNNQPISSWAVRTSLGKYSAIFEQREAARFGLETWTHFCELSGPEQSAIVAHYRLFNRLEWLEIKNNTR